MWNLLCHSPLLLRHSSLPLPGFKRFKLLQPSKSLAPPATTLTILQLLHGFLYFYILPPPLQSSTRAPTGLFRVGLESLYFSCGFIYWSCPATPTKGGSAAQGASPFYFVVNYFFNGDLEGLGYICVSAWKKYALGGILTADCRIASS